MKTFAIPALLVLGGLASCGGDDPMPEAPNTNRSAHVATKKPTPTVELVAAEVPAQPVMLPPGERRLLELEGGVRVEVLAEGLGAVVGPGDEVALSLTLTYVPEPAQVEDAKAESKDDAKKDSAKKDDAKTDTGEKRPSKKGSKGGKQANSTISAIEPENPQDAPVVKEPIADVHGDTKSDAKPDAKPDEHDAAKTPEVASEHPVAAKTDAGTHDADATEAVNPDGAELPAEQAETAQADGGVKPADTPDTAATEHTAAADGAPAAEAPPADATAPFEGTAPAPDPLAPALEPIVVMSTKNLGTPIRARVGSTTTLVPGLSRALVGLRQGTIAEITLPTEAGYGAAGLPSAGIPPGTTLHATIEIREVKR